MQREYQGFIFTKHALERLSSRSISQDAVVQVLRYPEVTEPSDKPGSTKFIKTVNNRLIHVVATHLPNQKTWLVISVWVRGEEDKESLAWQIITLPFKLIYQILRLIFERMLQ
jgi:hypothetical protein